HLSPDRPAAQDRPGRHGCDGGTGADHRRADRSPRSGDGSGRGHASRRLIPFTGHPAGNGGSSSPTGGTGTPSSGTTAPEEQTEATPADEQEATGVVLIDTQLGFEKAEAAGTGIVLSKDGLVLTNNHVIADSTKIAVTVATTGKTYTASVVGSDS